MSPTKGYNFRKVFVPEDKKCSMSHKSLSLSGTEDKIIVSADDIVKRLIYELTKVNPQTTGRIDGVTLTPTVHALIAQHSTSNGPKRPSFDLHSNNSVFAFQAAITKCCSLNHEPFTKNR